MNLFNICGEKIKNVKRALVVETLFQIYSYLPFECQSNCVDKQLLRNQFDKRLKAAQKERRKEYNRTLRVTKEDKGNKSGVRLERQGLFDENDRKKIKCSISCLFSDVEGKIKESSADPEIVAFVSTRLAAFISTVHLLSDEDRPSKIIATLTLAITSILPETSHKSLVKTMSFSGEQARYFKERFGFNPFVKQSNFDDENTDIAWIGKLPEYVGNWEAAKQSPAFSKVSELISIIATMGFIDGKYLTVSVKGLELFRLGTMRKHADATDLISAILSSVEYFISGGYEFFKTGNPRRFLFDDSDAKEFDELYEMLLEATPHAQSMNLPIMQVEFRGEKILMDDIKYLEHLEKAIILCKRCLKMSKNSWQTNFFQTRRDRMIGWRADYNARRSNGKFRKKPISMWLFGESGVGKSTLSQLFIKTLLTYMGVPENELDCIAYINARAKHDDTITGGTHAYLTDDVMNTKAEFLEKPPTQDITDDNNNTPLFANKAELEGKGVTPKRPKLTCYTSNNRIEHVARIYSNCTESINRRMIINLDIRVKENFRLPGLSGLDEDKVHAVFGDDPMPDVWEIKINVPWLQSCTGMAELDVNFRPTLSQGHLFNIFEIMEYCYRVADRHIKNQGLLEENQRTLVTRLKFCPDCKKAGKFCTCKECNESPLMQLDGIFASTNSTGTLDVMDELNNIGADNAIEPYIHTDDIFFANLQDNLDEETDSLVFEHQATVIPYPLDPIERQMADLQLEAPISFNAKYIPWKSLLPFPNIKRQPVIGLFSATFQDMVAWMEYMPSMMLNFGDVLIARFFTHSSVRRVYWILWSHLLGSYIRNVIVCCILVDIVIASALYIFVPFQVFAILCALLQVILACTAITLITKWYRDRMRLLDRMQDTVRHTYKDIKKINWKKVAVVVSASIVVYKVVSFICNIVKTRSAFNYVLDQQSALKPTDVEEVKERDSKVSDWAKPTWEELHVTHKARTTTLEQLKHKIQKNLYHVTFVAEDGSTNKCDGLVVEGNCMLLPLHAFGSKTKLKVLCRAKEGDGLNSVFRGHISLNMAATINGVDLAYVSAPFLNPHTNLVDYFPNDITHTRGVGAFLYKDADGKMKDDNVSFKSSINHSGGKGYTYVLPYNTFNGLCMGVLLGEFDVPCIVGVHLMGSLGTPVGLSLNVTRDMLHKLKEGMKDKPCMNAMSNGDFPRQLYGIEVVNQSAPIHPNSPLNYLPKYSKITALGNCPGRSSHTTSTVHKTIISDLVENVCGVPCKWGAPKFNSKRQWQASMQYSANTSCGLDPELLEWAMNDYEEDLITAFTQPSHVGWIKSEFKPLDDMEIMTGRDGVRFLDAMPKGTSKGFPLVGPKEEWITRLDPEAYENFNCPVAIRQEVLDLAEDMCNRFRRGERAYAIFKACVKDEPTPLDKDKVRVFQAAGWAFQLLVRKYFLPLARLMSIFPLHSECAVGINAHGPEWDEFANFMKQHGDDRILAGDYSKFDLRMPAQMLMATYKIFCNVCEKCGTYSEDDLTIMRGIATEISYSVVAYNGDLIIHNGSHPSGNNMTVYGNCVDNCLNFRCGYAYNGLKNGYTLKTLPKFKKVCALGTYGDDAKGSVKKGFDWFNHISFADYLEKNDIIFTMPDKTSTPTKYMLDSEADFLKRRNVFNEETGLIHGALDEDSIFKSLHTVLKSSVGPKAHAAGNIESALREWFHHGREVFDLRHKQMIEIAEQAQLQNLLADVNEETGVVMNSLYDDYDARLNQFRAKHLSL